MRTRIAAGVLGAVLALLVPISAAGTPLETGESVVAASHGGWHRDAASVTYTFALKTYRVAGCGRLDVWFDDGRRASRR